MQELQKEKTREAEGDLLSPGGELRGRDLGGNRERWERGCGVILFTAVRRDVKWGFVHLASGLPGRLGRRLQGRTLHVCAAGWEQGVAGSSLG